MEITFPAERRTERICVCAVGTAGVAVMEEHRAILPVGARLVVVAARGARMDPSLGADLVELPTGPVSSFTRSADSAAVEIAAAARQAEPRIETALAGADLVFVLAGMAGLVGRGSAPAVARAARQAGALTLGVAIVPPPFEGAARLAAASDGLRDLLATCDSVIAIRRDDLAEASAAQPATEAGRDPASLLAAKTVEMICSTLQASPINVDHADLGEVLRGTGLALVALGHGRGPDRALAASADAIQRLPLGGEALGCARGIVVVVRGGSDLSLCAIDAVVSKVHQAADADARIVYNARIEGVERPDLEVLLLATGFADPTVADSFLAHRMGRAEARRRIAGRSHPRRGAPLPERPDATPSALSSAPDDPAPQVFISYRREGGAETARSVRERLRQRGIRAFLDVEDLGPNHFDASLLEGIERSPNFVVILSSGCLDRCSEEDDWFRREIAHALRCHRNIVPIVKAGFEFPDRDALPLELRELPRHQGVEYSQAYFGAAMEKLVDFLALGPASLVNAEVKHPG